eukprot:3717805-Prymnesium_polylepis.1
MCADDCDEGEDGRALGTGRPHCTAAHQPPVMPVDGGGEAFGPQLGRQQPVARAVGLQALGRIGRASRARPGETPRVRNVGSRPACSPCSGACTSRCRLYGRWPMVAPGAVPGAKSAL